MLCCQTVLDPSLAEDPAKDPQYAESAVDAMRAQKDEVSLYFNIDPVPWKESHNNRSDSKNLIYRLSEGGGTYKTKSRSDYIRIVLMSVHTYSAL